MLRRTFLKIVAAAGALFSVLPIAKPIEAEEAESVAGEGPCPYVMLHCSGPAPCGKPAALMPENPQMGASLLSLQFRRLDGSRFAAYSVQICGSCGGWFAPVRRGIHTNEAEPKPVTWPRQLIV